MAYPSLDHVSSSREVLFRFPNSCVPRTTNGGPKFVLISLTGPSSAGNVEMHGALRHGSSRLGKRDLEFEPQPSRWDRSRARHFFHVGPHDDGASAARRFWSAKLLRKIMVLLQENEDRVHGPVDNVIVFSGLQEGFPLLGSGKAQGENLPVPRRKEDTVKVGAQRMDS
ncbi:MAG: hypothetical protein Q9194_006899 [Teloschistes cf. exilis]